MPSTPPEPPLSLSPEGRERFEAITTHLGGRWTDVWEPIVLRYVRAWEGAMAAWNGLPRDVYGGVVLTTTGSQGQSVQHPLWRAWLDASRAEAAAAAELGISPRQMADVVEESGDSIFDTPEGS